ncbi:MAG: iron-sulfur cluster assembly accessory protein [Bacteroidetes bacterium]|nr:iron-sulfur cluster assembly accessory protein [Bacteroidota bacterium]MBP7398451.1 iron-sulfur cluster assembly accessory protein [Chitinophagales bacterium]MBK7108484.1 iron-sulfur cluster assembly accessory protein [Bacteroidota bacterium]MBK8489194.1 iron-sulfur cluster assembly accessory protein [Bacteroidota bacterium]MBK8681045.1 iron-sulfur cluster assembly accessory protein [Bacteroidota bacterium]
MDVLTQSPVTLTASAYTELRKILIEKNLGDTYGLRIGVKGGGCAGMSYLLGFDSAKENDNTYKYDDLTIYMDKTHGMYLIGMEIDFIEGLNNRGFTFNNPNASKTCGCGTSFES